MLSLQLRMYLLIAVLFAIVYMTIVLISTSMGVYNFYFYLGVSVVLMLIQYMVGPKIIEWTMQLKYIKKEDLPKVYGMVEDLARIANIPMPRVCVSASQVPNAFAFGRSINDGRVCVSAGIMRLLNDDELRAVIGHELTHIKNRDVLTITLLSVVPMIMYRIAWSLMWQGNRRGQQNGGNGFILGLVAFLFYFVTNLLVLYGSRIREYYADKGAVELGCRPEHLATALYKLVYGTAKFSDSKDMKNIEGMKAFFINDPSRALNEIRDLKQLDRDNSGTIDGAELMLLRNKYVTMSTTERLMEFLSTHPNMLKRIKHLSDLKGA